MAPQGMCLRDIPGPLVIETSASGSVRPSILATMITRLIAAPPTRTSTPPSAASRSGPAT